MAGRIKLTAAVQDQVIELLRGGADIGMAARAVGVARETIHRLMARNEKFKQRCCEAREYADETIVQSLYEQAKAGNTTAIVFWLKNRRRDKWRDRYEAKIEHEGQVEFRVHLPDGRRLPSAAEAVPGADPDESGA